MDFAKYRYLVDEIDVERDRRNDGYDSYLWPLNASGMASRRAFIQGKIDELKKNLKEIEYLYENNYPEKNQSNETMF